MPTITLLKRIPNGAPLTPEEHDDNLTTIETNLNRLDGIDTSISDLETSVSDLETQVNNIETALPNDIVYVQSWNPGTATLYLNS